MASSAAAKPRARPRKIIAIQDLDALKAKKQQLKQDLKEMNKTVKVQQQKKRRLIKAAHNFFMMKTFYGFYVNVRPNEAMSRILVRIKMEMQLRVSSKKSLSVAFLVINVMTFQFA
jgi:hypothetical protein